MERGTLTKSTLQSLPGLWWLRSIAFVLGLMACVGCGPRALNQQVPQSIYTEDIIAGRSPGAPKDTVAVVDSANCMPEITRSPALDRELEGAAEVWRAGDHDRSIRLLGELTEREPGFLRAHLRLLDCRAMHGNTKHLPDVYNNVPGLEGRQPIATALKARALIFAAREKEALAVLDQAIIRYPNCPLLLVGRAEAHLALDSATEAIADCEHALEMDSSFALAHETLAIAYLSREPKDIAASEREVKAALWTEPGSASARAIGATIRYLSGDRSGALGDLRQLYSRHSDDTIVRSLYALTFPFDLRPPTDLLYHQHPTGYSHENGEWSAGFYWVGSIKRGLPGGITVGTSTLNWISKEPNLLVKLRLLREGSVRPALAVDVRYVGNAEIEDSDHHGSQVRVMAGASKRLLPRVSLHGGFGSILSDRESPFRLTDTTAIYFEDLEGFLALDIEPWPFLKLVLEPSLVHFSGQDEWDWAGAAGVIIDGGGRWRLKLGAAYDSWKDKDAWYPAIGLWRGR